MTRFELAVPLLYTIREEAFGHRVAWIDDHGHVHREERTCPVEDTRAEFKAAGILEAPARETVAESVAASIAILPDELKRKLVNAELIAMAEGRGSE
jgi:hypothetical protein